MPKYFKISIDDLPELMDACETVEELNEFVDAHYRYTCSCCGKDELYVHSPVLKDEVWKTVLHNANITRREMRGVSFGRRVSHQKEVRFYNALRRMLDVTPDDEYIMLCRDCMEKCLGRKLYKEDLADCNMTRNIINEFESKSKTMDRKEMYMVLADISARLPYGMIFQYGGKDYYLLENINYSKDYSYVLLNGLPFSDCKPCLRSMRSMTKAEKEELLVYVLGKDGATRFTIAGNSIKPKNEKTQKLENFELNWINFNGKNVTKYSEWMNLHHFDWHGLINKGLAVEAPEGMYKDR